MEGSETGSGRRRPTLLVVGTLVAILVAAVVLVVASGGGRDDKGSARSARTKPTRTLATTTSTRGPTKYTVKAGDTLSAIGKQFGVATRAIIDANQIPDPNHLTAGQVLEIPPVTPVRLVVRPNKVEVGGSVEIKLEGAQPAEIITFEIHRPLGTFTGPAHSAAEDGTVTTTYRLGLADTPGDYLVIAKGDQITTAQAAVHVIAATTTTTRNRSGSRGGVSSTT